MKVFFRANIINVVLPLLMFALTTVSCSNNDYVNAIPPNVIAIMKIDAGRLASKSTAAKLSALMTIEDISDCGLDFGNDVFAFETIDGNFGLCVKVTDSDKLSDTFTKMSAKGNCGKLRRQGDFFLSDIGNAWAVGFSDKAIVAIGPVSAASLGDEQQRLVRLLRQDDDMSVVNNPMYAKLDSINAPVAMVAQVQALPESITAPFTVGAPRGTDASQIMIASDISTEDGILKMTGKSFSFNKSIDTSLNDAYKTYRHIDDFCLSKIPADYKVGLIVNVDGAQYLKLLHESKQMQSLLAGVNTALDFDNIIRGVNGNLAVFSSGMLGKETGMNIFAKTHNPGWTADVEYWKQSCPVGSSITGANGSWTYSSGKMKFAFGIAGDMFYGTTDSSLIPTTADKTIQPISPAVQKIIKGSRMAMILNLSALSDGESLPGISKMTKQLLGDVNTFIYVLK